MVNQTLVYFNENLRHDWMKKSALQTEIEDMRAEALQAQLDYKEQQLAEKPRGQRNLLKTIFARLTRRNITSATR